MTRSLTSGGFWTVFFITSVGGESFCPKGGRVHLASQQCYWLSEIKSSWSEGHKSCKSTGGDMASADSLELQTFIFYSFPVRSTEWVWIKGRGPESDQAGALRSTDSETPVCSQAALGTQRGGRKARCAEQHRFLCEKKVSAPSLPADRYRTGQAFMTGIYAQTQISPLPSIPEIGQHQVEMQLFPGIWFSHAGRLSSVELVVQPSRGTSLARIQILRPYCNPNQHLVPPGCSSLLNSFSCCSAVPLCYTTGGCSRGQYWCYLLEACVCTSCPCSPYDSATGSRGFVLPPRFDALPPFYHLVADLPLRVEPSSDLRILRLLPPNQAIVVYPDDIVAVQHTRDSGTFLHCLSSEASLESPWRQSYLSLQGREWGGWWEGGLTSLPREGQWVDGVLCDLRVLYEENLPRGTEYDSLGFITTAPESWPLENRPTLKSRFGLSIIHPMPDENNQIHAQISVPLLIVVKVLSGENAQCSWSFPAQQTSIPLLPHCPEEVVQFLPDCKSDAWFSSVTLRVPSEGVETLNISVMDGVTSQNLSVRVCGYQAVTGLSVEPHGCWRMLVDVPQMFTARVESGSSVKFYWVIDDRNDSEHVGQSYSVVFKKPAEYKLRVTASNPVSSQNQQILLTADETSPLAEPEFLSIRDVIPVDAAHLYSLRVKADISLPVTFSWDFGDGRSKVVHTKSAPCLSMHDRFKAPQKQVYVQDSVNYTYDSTDDFTLHVQIFNQHGTTDALMKISTQPELNHLLISSSPAVPVVKQTLLLRASPEPFSHTILYTWHFGDSSEAFQGSNDTISHAYASAGVYNITVLANNTLTVLTSMITLEVREQISGLTVSHDGPGELSSPVRFRASLVSGTSVMWEFDFGDGNLQGNLSESSISHRYNSPGNYTVHVSVSNFVSEAHESISVEVFKLAVSGVLPMDCVMSGEDVQLRALVNGNMSLLTFYWLFGDESPLTVERGRSTTMHRFKSQGSIRVSLNVSSSSTSVSFSTSICVELGITNVAVQASHKVAAVGEEVCFQVEVSPRQMSGYTFRWFRSPSSVGVATKNSQECFVFPDEGVEELLVEANNRVSNQTGKVSVSIQRPVNSLSVAQDAQDNALTVDTSASFWVSSCSGSNVSVMWDFGDGSSVEQGQRVSHVFTSKGQFTVTATAFNAISRRSVTLTVNVLLPVSDLSLHPEQPYAAAGEETFFSAVSSTTSSSSDYFWTVDGGDSTKQGTQRFHFVFSKPGVYEVRVTAQNLVSRREAAILIEVFERIEGLQIKCQNLSNMKYVPTQEELLFRSSVSKGSNVTFHWLSTQHAKNSHVAGKGDRFQMVFETPGEIFVQLRASNMLGEATTNVSLEAVQSIIIANITKQSSTVALGELVNISVTVATGSHLEYFWYLTPDTSPRRTFVPFVLHNFTSLGHCLIKVSVQNVISHCNVSFEFDVQEAVKEVDFDIDGKTPPFYIATGTDVHLHGRIQKGSHLNWKWKANCTNAMLSSASNKTAIISFPKAGVYQVWLNVSNSLNWQQVSHSVTVLDALTGLVLKTSKSTICANEQVTFVPELSKGSCVTFHIWIENENWTYDQEMLEKHPTTLSLPAGTNRVTVRAWNKVSRAEVSNSILVTELIQGLQLVSCCSADLEPLKGIKFKADVQSGLPVNYTWVFDLVGSKPVSLVGQEVIFTPQASGSLSFRVFATNGVCSKTLNDTCTVHWPLKHAHIIHDSERVFVGHAVRFSAITNGGSNLSYLWNLGDASETLTSGSTLSHTYHAPGEFSIILKVLNSVSHVSTQLHVKVEELQCSSPEVSLVQPQSTIFRSRPTFFEARVDNNCSAYKTKYLWEFSKGSDASSECLEKKVTLRSNVDTASPFLFIPKHSLDIGRYCLVFRVLLQGTPLIVEQRIRVQVVHSPLIAVIRGGSHRLWHSSSDLVLDGSGSQDLDVEPGVEDALQYHWTMTANGSGYCPVKQPVLRSNSSRLTVPSAHLLPGTIYAFTLTVHKAGRTHVHANQTVTVCDTHLLPVIVGCVSCSDLFSPHKISYNIPVILSGKCEQCDDKATYKWSAVDETGTTLDLNEVTTSTGRRSANLEIKSDVLQPRRSYTFSLNVSQSGRRIWGSASLTVQPINPPYGGLCELSPQLDVHLLETLVTFTCSGWQDDDSEASQLIYTFQVVPCQSAGPEQPLLTLYRGTHSMYGTQVPVGNSLPATNRAVIRVTVQVENYHGAKVIALNRTLAVDKPADKVAGEWLRNKSQSEFWALVQHGNPQEIIPYSIALTSQLNQMESGWTASELADRRRIRENVTHVLASLPVSSLFVVDQISSALSLSTAVPDEMICRYCQEKVLEAVQKMIHVMQEHMSPGVLSAVDAGRNILAVIGNTLAAASLNSHLSSPQPASAILLSALGHVGDLMRSLMRDQVYGGSPLSLSNPYVNTVGFHGDPSNLLCTHRSNQNQISPHWSPLSLSCLFHIPDPLTTHLKAQESEVVQILFGVDADTGGNSFLTAADPPISTNLVAMELTTPQGQVIPIQDLDPEQAIRVTLPTKHPVGQNDLGGDGGEGGTCPTVTLPTQGQLNFSIKAVDGLIENAGLYVSFTFNHDREPASLSPGHVKIEVSPSEAGTNTSLDLLEVSFSLSASSSSTEKTVFLSPLLNGTETPLSVSLTSSLVSGRSVQVSVCVFSSLCRYYSVEERCWSSEGLQPLEGSTPHAAHCLTKHLTLFGASMFVHPGAVVLLLPPSGPVCNMVVGIVCAVLVLIHSLMGLIAHKLDYFNSLRMSQVPLCGQPGLYHYRVLVKTGWQRGAGTTAHVGICLYGVTKSGSRHLQQEGAFQRGSLDQFHLETDENLGEVWKIRIWHDSTGLDPSWYVKHVVVWDPQTDHMFFFLLEDWLAVENQKNSTVEKEVLASCPLELSQFGRVFSSQLMFGMVERHLWLSLWDCPAHSCFTRSQRVLCSALVLHLYLALGVLWFRAVGVEGSSEPVSAELLVNVETVAVGMTVALLVFPIQCCLCFLFRKCQSQVVEDVQDLTSPVCYSVEMDVSFDHLGLFGPSFLSFKDSSSPGEDSPSSLLESKVLDSSILDFWSSCGLVPQTVVRACKVDGTEMWQSCDDLPADPYLSKTLPAPTFTKMSPAFGRIHQLRRKKALLQLCRSSSSITDPTTASLSPLSTSALSNCLAIADQSPSAQKVSMWNNKSVQAFSNNLTTLLTLSDEDLIMSIAAASEDTAMTKTNSDSGWDSPRTTSSFSNTHSTSCSSWPEENEDKSLYGDKPEPTSIPFLSGTGLYKCASVLSVDSMASTFLPNPSPDTSRSCSATRIGVARSVPGWLLPPWTLSVIYSVVALMLGACLTVVGVYSSHMSRAVVLMWLVSVLSAFFTSALLLEPLKVFMQALISTALWRPVDPEVEDQLSWKSTVVRMFKEHGGKVRPPCGYGLLQAKEEARKVKALRSLMRHSVCQLIFLMLVLMVNYQDNVEKKQGRLLHSAVRRQLHTAPSGVPNITSLRDWSDADRWIHRVLIPHLHQSPSLSLVGVPKLQLKHPLNALQTHYLGNNNATSSQRVEDLHMETWSKKQLKSLLIDFTHSHRESALLVCVSIKLEWVHAHRLSPLLFIHTFLLPSSNPALDLQTVLMVLLLISGLLILFGELWTITTEHAQCHPQSLFQLLLALLSLATAILHFCFLLLATSCVSAIGSQTSNFIDFQSTALVVRGSSQCAAVLLTLLVLKLLRTLKFVQRWLVFGKVVQGAWRELLALAVLLVLFLLLCIHLGNTLFSASVEGFLTAHQTGVSVLSILRGRMTLQRLCRVSPVLGPLYGLIVVTGGVWLLARLSGAVVIHAYRVAQAEMYRPSAELQDYEMVMFFIKRLKLRLGLTKTKEFRHRVKFEGMDVPPSRSSCISTLSPSLSCPRSPSLCSSFSSQHPFSSALSLRSDDSAESGIDIQPYLDRLLPCLNSMIFHFDQVNQINEDIHDLEIQLEEAQSRRRKRLISCPASGSEKSTESSKLNEVEEGRETEEVRHRKAGFIHSKARVSLPSLHSFAPSKSRNLSASTCTFPRKCSESDSASYQHQASNTRHALEGAKDAPGSCSLHPAVFPGFGRSQRRRAWHSGSSHSADAVQRIFMTQGGLATSGNGRENVSLTNSRPRSEQGVRRHISNGVPVKRKAWISEPSETEQD